MLSWAPAELGAERDPFGGHDDVGVVPMWKEVLPPAFPMSLHGAVLR